jgi:hypothetical protein
VLFDRDVIKGIKLFKWLPGINAYLTRRVVAILAK